MGKKGFFSAAKRRRELAKQEKKKKKVERRETRRIEAEQEGDGVPGAEPDRTLEDAET